jgi:predicted RNase H-like HicB family nuclease
MLRFILTGYIEHALSEAEFDKLKDGTFYGRIPRCKGVVAFGKTLKECENELRSTLEDWILLGLKLGHALPVLNDYDLNQDVKHETVEAM